MKKTIALLVVALLVLTALSAKAINMGMDISECKDPIVVDFLNYMTEEGFMDENFYYYSLGLDETGEYYVNLTPVGAYYQTDILLYFFDDNVEMSWYGNNFVSDENYLAMLFLINDFNASYANWATFFIDSYYDDCLATTSIMSLAGVESYGEAIWSRLELYLTLSDMGFYDIEKSLEEYLTLN